MFRFLRGNILVMTVTRILGFFSRGAAFPYASLYILALGGTSASVGFTNSLRPIASLIFFPIAGFIADYSGRVKLIVTALFLSGLTYLFYIFANDWIWVAIGNFLTGLIIFHFPAQSALVADSLPPEQRGIGFATYSAIPGAVAIIAPYLAGYFIDEFGVELAMRYLYTCLLVSYIASAIIQNKFLTDAVERPRFKFRLTNFKNILVKSYSSTIEALKWMPTSLKVLTLIIALSFTANAVTGAFWVVYGIQVIGLSASEWGLLILIYSALRIVFSIPAGVVVDRFGRRKTMIVSLIPTIPSVLFFIYAKGFWEVSFILIMLSIANAFLDPACSSLIVDLVPRDMRGRIMSALGRGALRINPDRTVGGGPEMGFIFSLPVMLGSIIGGTIFRISPEYPWIIQAFFLLSNLILSVILLREPEKAAI